MPALKFEIKRKCEVCGSIFVAKTLDSKCCSEKCIKVAGSGGRMRRRNKNGSEQ